MPFEILFFQKFIDKILEKPLLCISSAATVDIFVKIPTTDSIVFILVYMSVM